MSVAARGGRKGRQLSTSPQWSVCRLKPRCKYSSFKWFICPRTRTVGAIFPVRKERVGEFDGLVSVIWLGAAPPGSGMLASLPDFYISLPKHGEVSAKLPARFIQVASAHAEPTGSINSDTWTSSDNLRMT